MPFNFGTPAPAATNTPQPTGSFNFSAGAPANAGSFNFTTGASTHPKKANGAPSFLEKVSDVVDVPLAYLEAGVHDIGEPGPGGNPFAIGEGTHTKQVTKDLQAGGPHQVAQNDIYFRKGSLQRVLSDPTATAQQKQTAQYFLRHPWVAAGADFATEFANPSNLVGGIVGRGASLVSKIPRVAQSLDEMQALAKIGNRFSGLRAAARTVGSDPEVSEQWGRDLVGARAKGEEQAFREAQDIFGGLTRDEQMEVVHRMQGNRVQSFGAKDADLDKRAQLLSKNMWNILREQLRSGVIEPSKIYGKEELFPGVFDDVLNGVYSQSLNAADHEEITRRALSGERPQVSMSTPNLTPKNAAQLAAHNDLLNTRADMMQKILVSDAPASAHTSFFPMSGAFQMPDMDAEYREFLDAHRSLGGGAGVRLGTAGQNAPRRGYRTLLEAQQHAQVPLRADWTPGESYFRFVSQRAKNVAVEDTMQDLLGMGLSKPKDMRVPGDRFANTTDVGSIRTFGSPTLRDQAIHEHVVNFLEDLGATKAEATSFAHATTGIGRLAQLAPKGYNASQQVLRQGIVFNPVVHVGWNLMFQYLGAGGDITKLPKVWANILGDTARYARKLPSAIPHGSLEAEQEGAILSRGAPRALTGESMAPNMLRPMSDLTLGQKVARGSAAVSEANQKLVFDIGERHIANALYETYRSRGLAPAMASIAVRKALGDYANVRNVGTDAVLNRAFFFYPWLKTILPFWIKTGATKPQTWNAPVSAIRTGNELAGDPNVNTGNVSPFAVYTGTHQGKPSYYSVPLPQRILEQAGQLAEGAVTGNRQEAAKGVQGLALNRLNPMVAGGLNTLYDVAKGGSQPNGLLGYAPPLDRAKAAVGSLGDYIPGPIRGAADVYRLIHGDVPPAQVLAEMFGGFGYDSLTPGQRMVKRHIDARFYQHIDHALRIGNKPLAWMLYQRMEQARKRAGVGG